MVRNNVYLNLLILFALVMSIRVCIGKITLDFLRLALLKMKI